MRSNYVNIDYHFCIDVASGTRRLIVNTLGGYDERDNPILDTWIMNNANIYIYIWYKRKYKIVIY